MTSTKTRFRNSVLSRSAAVLTKKDKNKLVAIVFIQISLGLLDLIGVGLVGVVGSLTISGVSTRPPGDRVQWLLDQLQLGGVSLQTQVAVLALLAVLIMTTKTMLSMFFVRRVLYFLSFRGAKLSSILISRLLAQPLLTLQRRSSQETLFAITAGVNAVTIGVLATFVSLLSDASLLLVMAIGLFVVDPLLSATTFLLFSSLALVLYKVMRVRARKLGEQNRQINVDSNELILEALTSYRELVVKNRRHYYSEKIGEHRNKLAKATAELSFMPNISKYVFEIGIIFGGLLISALQFWANDAVRAVATLSIFFAASARIAPAVLRVQQSSLSIRASAGTAQVTLDLIDDFGLDSPNLEESKSLDFRFKDFNPEIKMEDVSFAYPGSAVKAVDNLSVRIREGEIVALVGPSGAGKTTLVDLMLGILKPDSGKIQISGLAPLEAVSKWPGSIGYMPQDILVINGTVRENVMLGYDPDLALEDKVRQALTISQLTQFVSELPNGLDQEMGERGTKMSGGQRQRLGIARAIFTSPRVLVLDEATSALDGETEANISNALRQLGGNVTVVLIAHRLTTVRSADRVIYIDKGKVIAQGTFEEVRATVADFDRQANLMGH